MDAKHLKRIMVAGGDDAVEVVMQFVGNHGGRQKGRMMEKTTIFYFKGWRGLCHGKG